LFVANWGKYQRVPHPSPSTFPKKPPSIEVERGREKQPQALRNVPDSVPESFRNVPDSVPESFRNVPDSTGNHSGPNQFKVVKDNLKEVNGGNAFPPNPLSSSTTVDGNGKDPEAEAVRKSILESLAAARSAIEEANEKGGRK
jgi:hypothetical protein